MFKMKSFVFRKYRYLIKCVINYKHFWRTYSYYEIQVNISLYIINLIFIENLCRITCPGTPALKKYGVCTTYLIFK